MNHWATTQNFSQPAIAITLFRKHWVIMIPCFLPLILFAHKSHLMNRRFISFIDHDGFVVLNDNTKVEVNRRRKEEVMAALK